jgi:hypothetical protein
MNRKGEYIKQKPKINYDNISIGSGKHTTKHRKVWSDNNGKIPKGKVIHHINQNIKDNRIENLMCLTPSEHMTIHKETRRLNKMSNKILTN